MGALIPHNPSPWLLRICGCALAALFFLAAPVSVAQTQTPSSSAATHTIKPVQKVKPEHKDKPEHRDRPAHPTQMPRVARSVQAVPAVLAGGITVAPPDSDASDASAQDQIAQPGKDTAAADEPEQTDETDSSAAPAAKYPELEAPAFPINGKPVPAVIHWDSQGLRIEAANSSLEQIMKDFSTATGTTVEGLETDQRVFGAYGPGPAREVLSELLQGTGYNVVMVGDQGQGTPRRIILSSPNPTSAKPAATPAQESDDDADAEDQPGQPQGQFNRPGFANGMPQRMPHRIPPGQQGQSEQPGQPQPNNGPQN
jgi:hypothetical protein